ncbi:MAG: methyltransferase domain-containing protein, partial [Bacteroidota bacterium]
FQFRFPRDSTAFLEKFYQTDYAIDTHMMTQLPDAATLEQLKAENFPDQRNYSPYVRAISAVADPRVVDYGCSWGYTLYQMQQEGLDVQGYELSRPRAAFGAQLDVEIQTDVEAIRKDNDVFMSSHVIEHLPDLQEFIALARSRLKENGTFMAFCPNGAAEYRAREPQVFHVNWGFVHPNYLDIAFACHAFKDNPYLILTGDWTFDLDTLKNWDGRSQVVGPRRDGKELLIISKPNTSLAG